MHICAGIDENITEDKLKLLILGGADEFFAGYVHPEWIAKFGFDISINRRYCKDEQFTNKSKLREVVGIIHSRKCKFFLVLNEHYYNKEQIRIIKKILRGFIPFKIDAFIIANLQLIPIIKEVIPGSRGNVL